MCVEWFLLKLLMALVILVVIYLLNLFKFVILPNQLLS